MSSSLPAPIQALVNHRAAFDKQNNWGLKFETECLFAKQQLLKNSFTLKIAGSNSESLKSAILNVAAIGVSLNPASAHAYLVPRDGMICLDLSYRGLVKLATDCGAISWAKTELVYEGDEFKWVDMVTLPLHTFAPFDPMRVDETNPLKNLLGGYCVAQLVDGTYLIDRMTAAEIIKIKNSSKAKNGPWQNWAGEMAKKTLVKRAAKSWPQSAGRSRLDEAMQIINEHEGLDMDNKTGQEPVAAITPEQETEITGLLLKKGASAASFCKAANIESVAMLEASRFQGAVNHLNAMPEIEQ